VVDGAGSPPPPLERIKGRGLGIKVMKMPVVVGSNQTSWGAFVLYMRVVGGKGNTGTRGTSLHSSTALPVVEKKEKMRWRGGEGVRD